MASFVARRTFSTSLRRFADDHAKQQLTQESKRNPELYVRDISHPAPKRPSFSKSRNKALHHDASLSATTTATPPAEHP